MKSSNLAKSICCKVGFICLFLVVGWSSLAYAGSQTTRRLVVGNDSQGRADVLCVYYNNKLVDGCSSESIFFVDVPIDSEMPPHPLEIRNLKGVIVGNDCKIDYVEPQTMPASVDVFWAHVDPVVCIWTGAS